MSYQFFRIEAYSLVSSKLRTKPTIRKGVEPTELSSPKLNLKEVIEEMERVPHACVHIPKPKPAVSVWGSSPSEVLEFVRKQIEGAIDSLGRGVRIDALVAVSGVASYPIPAEQLLNDVEAMSRYEHWESLLIDFLRKEYGSAFRSAVRHEDETYLHVHFLLSEQKSEDGKFGVFSIHPGRREREKARKQGKTTIEQEKAYKDAMAALQDRYYESVSIPCSHEKNATGTGRKRFTREEWMGQKFKNNMLQQMQTENDNLKAEIYRLKAELAKLQATA